MSFISYFLDSAVRPVVRASIDMSGLVKAGSLVMGALMIFLAPVKPFIIAAYILLAADVVLGLWASRRVKEPFTSLKLGRTVGKFVTYTLAIVLAQVMVKTFFDGTPILEGMTYTIALFICTVEFKSCLENIAIITGLELWAQVADFLASKVKISKAQNKS